MAWYRCGGTPSNILALPTPSEASGAIARFNTDLTENLLHAIAEFNASQAAGTPTPVAPIPLVGVDKVNFTLCGKNLFNPNNVIDAYLNTSAVIRASASTKLVFAKCKPNTTYTVSKTAGQRFQVAYCDSLPEAELQCSGMITNGTASSITITTGATAKYLVAYVYHSSYDTTITAEQMISSVQIQLGSTATDYEPYNGTTALINLGGTYYGGSVDAVTGKITNERDKKKLSDYTWIKGNANTAGTGRIWRCNFSSLTVTPDDYTLCDSFKKVSWGVWESLAKYEFMCAENGNFVFCVEDDYTDANAMLAVYGNIEFSVKLKTPETVYASNTAEIPTIVGDNQVFADTGDVAVKYFETVGHKI